MTLAPVRSLLLRTLALNAPRSDGSTEQEILLIKPDHLGDVLFVTPALRRLRRALPGWRIALAVGPWSTAVVRDNADVDEILEIPFPGFTRSPKPNPLQPYQVLLSEADRLRERRPSAALILRDDHWWGALLAARAGIPIRIGADHPSVRPFLTHPIPIRDTHWVRRNLALVEAGVRILTGISSDDVNSESEALEFSISASDRATAARLIAELGVQAPYIAIHPGTGARVKLWPAERWSEVVDALGGRGYQVIATGTTAEAGLIEEMAVAARTPVHSLAGRSDLRTLAALFEGAQLVLGVDSGPLHLAVAAGARTVHLYGPSDPDAFGPWGTSQRHCVVSAGMRCPRCGDLSLTRPPGAGCMLAITPARVIGAALEMLAGV
jgi:heptosyltransferase-2/heptosyltransferase-3